MFCYLASGVVHNSSHNFQYCDLLTQNEKAEQSLQKFCEIKNVSDSNSLIINEEKFCQSHIEMTHYRTSNGQYVVSMPVEDATFFRESKNLAEKRLD